MATLRVFQDKAGEWRWNKRSGSDLVADSGEGYVDKQDAVKGAEGVAQEGDTLQVENADGDVAYEQVL